MTNDLQTTNHFDRLNEHDQREHASATDRSAPEQSPTQQSISNLMSTADDAASDEPAPRIVTMNARPAGSRASEPADPSDDQSGDASDNTAAESATDAEPAAGSDAESSESSDAPPAKGSKKKKRVKKKAVTRRVAARSGAAAGADNGDDDDASDAEARAPMLQRSGSREIEGPEVKNRLVINYVPGEECRVAVVMDSKLEELHAEKAGANTIVGNIYVGKVTNVEQSIQAAFVDFGHGANGFLHVSDLHPQYFPGAEDEETERIGKKTPRRDRPPIQRCLKRGQEIFVQVIKEGISTKGPTLTSYLSIPGRYVVMLPFMDKVGVSRKVEDDDERRELRKVLDQIELPKGFGFIGRTAGIGKTKTEIKRDLAYLQRLWKDIERRHKSGKGPRLLYAESDLLMRVLRDVWTNDIEEIVIDNESAVKRADRFLKIMAPRTDTRLAYYDEPRPIFHAFGLEKQIEQVFARQVPLPSGGYLVFDEAEALIAIDVNSGKSRSAGDAESNAFNTNREAVEEICRQLKLRDVGGLVLLDLIDMMHRSNRREIEKIMTERLKRDRAATRFLPISDFGIMEMTRQRFRGSLKSMHFTTCPTCVGRAHVRKPTSLANGLLRTVANLFAYEKVIAVKAEVSARVATELLTHKRHQIARLEHVSGKKFDVIVSEEMGVDHVALVATDAKGDQIELDRLPMPNPPKRLEAWGGGLKPSDNWSVDAADEREAARREAMTIIAAEAALPEEPADDPLLSDDLLSDELVDEALGEEAENATLGRESRAGAGRGKRSGRGASPAPAADSASDSEGGSKKKRRRRRRRGGQRADDADASADSADSTRDGADRPRTHAPSRSEAGADGADGEGGEEGSGRKRRRRRRRRGGRRGEESGEGNPTAQNDRAQRSSQSQNQNQNQSRSQSQSQSRNPGSNAEAGSPVRKRIVVKKVVRRAADAPGDGRSGAAAASSGSASSKKMLVKKKRAAASEPRGGGSAPEASASAAQPKKKVVKRIAKKSAGSATTPAASDAPAPASKPGGASKKPARGSKKKAKKPSAAPAVDASPSPASTATDAAPKKKKVVKKATTKKPATKKKRITKKTQD
ncbi:MAG: Rne/Rng family ribonuclease [Phycisphaerales bacterium]